MLRLQHFRISTRSPDQRRSRWRYPRILGSARRVSVSNTRGRRTLGNQGATQCRKRCRYPAERTCWILGDSSFRRSDLGRAHHFSLEVALLALPPARRRCRHYLPRRRRRAVARLSSDRTSERAIGKAALHRSDIVESMEKGNPNHISTQMQARVLIIDRLSRGRPLAARSTHVLGAWSAPSECHRRMSIRRTPGSRSLQVASPSPPRPRLSRTRSPLGVERRPWPVCFRSSRHVGSQADHGQLSCRTCH